MIQQKINYLGGFLGAVFCLLVLLTFQSFSDGSHRFVFAQVEPVILQEQTVPLVKAEGSEMARKINEFSLSIGSPLKDNYGDFIVSLGEKYDVHPYFIVAVGFADSSLGKNLTTRHNIGNVGNTDSCPTCRKFDSWEQGLEAVAQTIVNRYLGHYKYVYQFSRGGQTKYGEFKKGSKYYASSMVNWNNNTSKAFSQMLGVPQNDKLCVKLSCYK